MPEQPTGYAHAATLAGAGDLAVTLADRLREANATIARTQAMTRERAAEAVGLPVERIRSVEVRREPTYFVTAVDGRTWVVEPDRDAAEVTDEMVDRAFIALYGQVRPSERINPLWRRLQKALRAALEADEAAVSPTPPAPAPPASSP